MIAPRSRNYARNLSLSALLAMPTLIPVSRSAAEPDRHAAWSSAAKSVRVRFWNTT